MYRARHLHRKHGVHLRVPAPSDDILHHKLLHRHIRIFGQKDVLSECSAGVRVARPVRLRAQPRDLPKHWNGHSSSTGPNTGRLTCIVPSHRLPNMVLTCDGNMVLLWH